MRIFIRCSISLSLNYRLEGIAYIEANPRYRSCLSRTCRSGQVHNHYIRRLLSLTRLIAAVRAFILRLLGANGILVVSTCSSSLTSTIPAVLAGESRSDQSDTRYYASHSDAASVRTSEEMVKKEGKKCPGKGCGIYIENNGGRNSKYYDRCHTQWKWATVRHEVR